MRVFAQRVLKKHAYAGMDMREKHSIFVRLRVGFKSTDSRKSLST
jgi:hypothetical protein